MKTRKGSVDGMSERQALRIIEIYENGSRNGEEWAHDVCLHRGTDKYHESIETLNQALRIAHQDRVILPLPPGKESQVRRSRGR